MDVLRSPALRFDAIEVHALAPDAHLSVALCRFAEAILPNNLLPPRHVIPDDVAVQLAAGTEEDAAFRAFGEAVREADVVFGLVPGIEKEDVYRHAIPRTQE